jgi:hypothetical protein
MAVSQSNEKFEKILSASQCAKLCDQFSKYPCRGFSYCQSSMTCYLSKTHLSDSNGVSIDTDIVCPHYRSLLSRAVRFTNTTSSHVDVSRVVLEGLHVQIDFERFDHQGRHAFHRLVN